MDLWPSPEGMKVRVERQKAPNEEAATEKTGALKDQYGNCYPDVPRAIYHPCHTCTLRTTVIEERWSRRNDRRVHNGTMA
jgi:hypothetical protein